MRFHARQSKKTEPISFAAGYNRRLRYVVDKLPRARRSMGIRFLCPACEKKIHVKDHQAGLRGFCPKCGARVDIPLHSTLLSKKRKGTDLGKVRHPSVPPGAVGEQTLLSLLPPTGRLLSSSAAPPADPLGEHPDFQWYVVPQGGTEPFGPADGRLIGQWMHEGRIGARSMIWRQDWPQWRKAGNVWSRLILAEPEPVSRAEQRFQGAQPQFGVKNLPTSPVPIPVAAEGATAPRRPPHPVSPPPTRSDPSEDELYYPQRSHGIHLGWVVLLAAAVIGLGFVMFKVIDRLQHPQPAQQEQPAEPTKPESVAPENQEQSDTTAGRDRSEPMARRS